MAAPRLLATRIARSGEVEDLRELVHGVELAFSAQDLLVRHREDAVGVGVDLAREQEGIVHGFSRRFGAGDAPGALSVVFTTDYLY